MAKAAVKKKVWSTSIKMNGMVMPRTAMNQKFCKQWLKHKDHLRAAEEAGMTPKAISRGGAMVLLTRYKAYLSQKMERHENAVAKELVLEQKDILNEMMAIGFANAQDYYVITDEVVNGKNIKKRTLKPIEELTRAQAAAVSCITQHPDGSITYVIPDEKSKHPYLKDLGQHLGLFHPKLIQEHRHQHIHAALSFRDLDPAKLEQFETQLIEALGPAGRRMLGIIDGEETPEQDVRTV